MGIEPDIQLPDSTLCLGTPPLALRILVAEDNLTNQKVILHQLQSLGYEADLVAHGQAAVDATTEAFYHVVLMDCRLPKLDGYTATRLIRQQEQIRCSRRSVIIALTANDNAEAEYAASSAGMDDFLSKPLRRETLAAMLAKWSRVIEQTEQSDGQCLIATPHSLATLTKPTSLALHFDLTRLHQLSDWDQEFEQELLQLYLDDMQDQLQQLLQASQKQNFSQIARTAHHIRGASASVGAFQLEAISEKLEQAAQQQSPAISSLIRALKQVSEQVQLLFQEKG